jgi:hypothetical protein
VKKLVINVQDIEIAGGGGHWLYNPGNKKQKKPEIVDKAIDVLKYDENQPRDEKGRWTDGGGQSSMGNRAYMDRMTESGGDYYGTLIENATQYTAKNLTNESLQEVVKHLGFEGTRVSIHDAPGPDILASTGLSKDEGWSLSGVTFFDPSFPEKYGSVELYRSGIRGDIRPTLVHELQHLRTQDIIAAVREDLDTLGARVGKVTVSTLNAAAPEFPLAKRYMDAINFDRAGLAADDGVTAYSADWWGRVYQDPSNHEVFHVAMSETFSEIARTDWMREVRYPLMEPTRAPSPRWRELYDDLNRLHDNRLKGKKP